MRIGKLLSGLALSFALLFAAHLSFAQLQQTGSGKKPGVSGWSPLTVSAAFWYDASDAGSTHVSGSDITTWDDISGNGRHLTQAGTGGQLATLVSNVKNSMPGVLFNGASADGSVLTTTSAFSVSFPNTVMVAFVGASTFLGPSFAQPWLTAASDQAMLINGGLKPSIYAGSTITDISASNLSASRAYIWYAQFNGSSSHGGIDSGANDVGPINPGTGTITSTNIQFGKSDGVNADIIFLGYILEGFAFAGVSNTDRDNGISYLVTKWGGFP